MKIGCLGAGAWGFTIATMLAESGHKVICFEYSKDVCELLRSGKPHPKLGIIANSNITMTNELEEAVSDVEFIVESVTSQGVRPVLSQLKKLSVPLVMTSKGIEADSGLLLTEVAAEIVGKEMLACVSGPTIAVEVMKKLPTSAVCSAYNPDIIPTILAGFNAPYFRLYPNTDMVGVSFGGAMKNIIAIACGIADGLGYGDNTKAALMTRGLHEIKKLAVVKGCKPETLNGLSGMGDLCVTCLSVNSRNYTFGKKLASGLSPDEAKSEIGMVVEGAFTCKAALQLGEKHGIDLPITKYVHAIVYEGMKPDEAVKELLSRAVKEEHL